MSSFFSRLIGSRHTRKRLGKRPAIRTKTTRLALEPLETRLMLSNITTLRFNIPTEVAKLGVQAGLYSNKSMVYLDATDHQFKPLSSVSAKLPLITLATAGKKYTEPVTYDLAIPAGQNVKSGELFLFVGTVHTGLAIAQDGTVAAPKAAPTTSAANLPDNFAQIEFNYEISGDSAGLDVDTSAVDSTGFPFTLVYPQSANLPYPLNPLGITLDQTDLNADFQIAFSTGGDYSQYPNFIQCATFAQQQDPNCLQVVAPQDILAAESTPPNATSATATADTGSQLAAGAYYYYCVTAYSDNVIANSNGVLGETLPSNVVCTSALAAGNSVDVSWTRYYDPNTAGYNVYRYSSTDGAPPTSSTAFNLIAHVSGALATSYVDRGAIPQAQQIAAATANNYGFNPLSEYYTASIQSFFDHYLEPNSFVLNRNGTTWVGNTVTYTPTAAWNTSGASYRVLQLTAQSSVAGKQIHQGDVVNIYEPIFASNTRFAKSDAPPMPSWMTGQNGANAHESPAQMVFGCDTAFASDAHDPDVPAKSDLSTALGAIENSIVSAFNRGIATNYEIPPNNWASFPQMLGVPTVAANSGSQVTTTTTYYYAVTAVNVYGETTPSLEVKATLDKGQGATLSWSNGANAAPATAFKVYRGASPDNLTLLYTTPNGQQTSYTDLGAAAPAGPAPTYQYFTPGTTANWYAAFVQQDSLLDPVSGVSINGLSYGFPYSDQGGVSTNIMFPPAAIPESITVNLGSITSPGFVTQSLPDALVGTAYRQTIVASGSGTGTHFTVASGVLPSWLTLDSDTGVLSGTAPSSPTSTPHSFSIKVANSAGSTTMPFGLNVINALPVTPVVVTGLSSGNLNLPAADINVPYTTQVSVTGGTGPYTLNVASTSVLPPGLQLGTLGTQPITSPNGVFTLSGTQTQQYVNPGIGFNMIASDARVASASVTLGITAASVDHIISGGAGYRVGDQFNVTGSGGSGAVMTAATVDVNGCITSIAVAQPGSGFTSSTLTFSPVAGAVHGSGANFAFRGDRFQAIVSVTNAGRGYASVPAVTFVGGGAGTTTGTATLGTGAQAGKVVTVTPPAGTYFTPAAGIPQVYIAPPTAGAQAAFTMKLLVNPTLDITTASLPDAVQNQPYWQTIATNNQAPGVQFTVTGNLPEGLSLTRWGVLSGTPTQSGSFSFTPTAQDSAGATKSKPFSLQVDASGGAPLAITTTTLPPAAPHAVYQQTIGAAGGCGNVTFAIVNGALPGGMTLSSSGQITSSAGGVSPGLATFTVRATDSMGNAAYQGFQLGVLDVTSSTKNLAANATTLVIAGAGFDPTPAHNTVTLPGSGANNIQVTAATPTALTVAFTGPLTPGPLNATVIVDQAASTPQQVATVVAASTPTITASTNKLAANATTLVITGSGFDTATGGTNVVALSSGTVQSVTVNSTTKITVTLAGPLAPGALLATVTTDGVTSSSVQVADIVAAAVPSVDINTSNLYSNATTLVIGGVGFDPSATGTNVVRLSVPSGAVSVGSVTVDSANQLTVSGLSLSGLTGPLTAVVTVNGVASHAAQVANLMGPSTPIIALPSPIPKLAPNATSLTIHGWGFSPGCQVALTGNYQQGPAAITGFTTTVDTPNQITLTDLNIPATGQLGDILSIGATLTDPINHSSGADPVTLANILPLSRAVPTITAATTDLSASTTTLVIHGSGFDASGTNAVTLYVGTESGPSSALPVTAIAPLIDGSGPNVVASADGTQLTVTLAGPLPVGALYAAVTTDGVPAAGGPVQVANVVGPSITASTTDLSQSPTLLVVQGVGFDPLGSNVVTLYSGQGQTELPANTIESVTVNSSTQLTVVLNGASPLPAGELSASLTVDGVSAGAPVEVASVVAQGPAITFAVSRLAANAKTLVIQGANFGTAAGSNTVTLSTFAGPISGAVASVTADSASQLTVTLAPSITLPAGQLYATVSTAAAASSTVQVANIVAASTPTIDVNTANLAAHATSLVITGTGFDPSSDGTNLVTLTSGTVQSVTVNSTTQLTVTFAGPLVTGALKATVTTDGVASALQQVATVTASATPTITPSTGTLAATATSLVIRGTGFDTNSGAINTVTLSSGTVQSVAVNSSTQLTVTLNPGAAPLASGPLTATVTVNGVASNPAQVANVVATPVITASSAYLLAGTPTLRMTGTGFDPTDANNSVALSSGAGEVTSASSTELIVRLTKTPTAGPLSAHVVVDGVVSQQALVAMVFPDVTASTANLPATATTLTITGIGFDPIASHNLIALSSGSGVVTSATATRLVVSLTPPQLGLLTAFVIVNGQSTPAQVANVVPGPASTATSTLTVSAASFAAGGSTQVTLQAKDALGNNLSTGGLKVTFALAAGSTAGRLSAVRDNRNGTYTATFTSSTMGSATFTARLNGNNVHATAKTAVVFQSNFPGSGALKAPWLVKAGRFTVASGAATAGPAPNSVAIYNGTAAQNLSASATVSDVGTGDLAALVARYSANTGYYRAGLLNVKGSLFAVIQRVTISKSGQQVVKTLSKQAVTLSSAGTIRFALAGSSLRLFLNGTLVATATDAAFRGGSVGIGGSAGTTFASFTAAAAGS